jgi:hypothetical protein
LVVEFDPKLAVISVGRLLFEFYITSKRYFLGEDVDTEFREWFTIKIYTFLVGGFVLWRVCFRVLRISLTVGV